MRRRIAGFLFVVAFPMLGFSQSTLNFPKLFSPLELSNTGFAVVNPGSSAASVTFTLYRADGVAIASKTYSGSDLPSGGQFSRTGGEVFQSPPGNGWVQATSATTGLQGFWINYNGSLTALDGAEAVAATAEQVIPLAAGQTEINVANPNPDQSSVSVRYINEAGQEVASSTSVMIPTMGAVQLQAPQSAELRHVLITSAPGVAATALVRGYLVPQSFAEIAVINGTPINQATNEVVFPHLANGALTGANYATEIGVSNLSAQSQTVTITFTPDNGPALIRTRLMAPNGALRVRASDLFGLPPSYVGGWLRVGGSAPITGYVAYADTVAGALVAVSAGSSKSNLLFAHIANGPSGASPWETGLALLNAAPATATVELFAMTPTGVLLGSAIRTVPAQGRLVGQLHNWIPQTAGVNGGFVYVRSSTPLYGIELFYTQDVKILSNVPAGGLAAGITYNPPGALNLTSVNPTPVSRGATLTLTGSGFSATASNNTVRFTTAAGMQEVTPTTATATTLTATVPATAISGPVLVRVGSQLSNALIVAISETNSQPLSTQTNVNAGQMTSNVDIYVPPSNAPANVSMIGLAPVGATSFQFGFDSLEIAPGTTRDLLVVLTPHLTQAMGTTVRISGANDVQVLNPRFLTLSDGAPALIVQLQVAISAVLGPRNIVVANNNLELAVYTGGLYIK